MGKRVHKDVEFAVGNPKGGPDTYHKTFEEACAEAVVQSLYQEQPVNIDLLCYSKAGFQAAVKAGFGYDDSYDPDASVTQRFVVKATDQGKIP